MLYRIYAITTLLTAISGFAIGIFALILQPGKKLVRIWFVLCLMIGGWNLGYYLTMIENISKQQVIISSRISHACGILIAVLFFHFVLEFLNLVNSRKKILRLAYVSCGAISLLSLTPFVVTDLQPKLFMRFYPVGKIGYGVYVFFFISWVIYAHKLMFNSYRRVRPYVRNQLKYFLTGTVLGFFGGSNCFPLIFGFHWLPYASNLIFVYPFTTTYAMFKYRLMEIEVVIKKTLIFAGLSAFVFAIFAGVTFVAQEFLVNIIGGNTRYIILFLSVALITMGIRPLEKFLVNLTDNILFQRKYDYHKTLREASEGMTLITDMRKLLNFIVRVVTMNIRVKSAGLFQFDENKDKYVLKVRRGTNRKHTGYSLDPDNELLRWLKSHKEILLYDDVEDWLKSEKLLQKEDGLKGRLVAIKEYFLSMDAVVCVPSFSKGRLIGFLMLGEKLSGDIYSQDDLHLLSTLASEAAIAVENARNFMEVEKLREKERESYIETVLALAQTVDEKDSYTHGHLEEVAFYGMNVAEELEKSSEFTAKINKEDLETALKLHDIGKIGVPDAILHKNGNLKPEEWVVMKQHCEIGARIVEPIAKLKRVGNIIKHHQERYDGTGYPDGLKGEEIPLESRIIAVVDAYHAIVSDRPYRKAVPEEVALQELKNNIGTQFDPVIVGAFVRAWEKGKIEKI